MVIAAVIAFLGLIIGQVLASQVKEELKIGKKWFKLISKVLLLIILFKLALLTSLSLSFFIALLAGVLINYFLKRLYLYFGFLILMSSFMNLNDKLFFASLIFLFGLTFGSLIYTEKKKFNYKGSLINLILFLLPFLFLLTKDFVVANGNLFTGFILGGLIIGFKKLS